MIGKVGLLDACYVFFTDGSLGCLVDTCIDVKEWTAVGCDACSDGFVEDGTQYTHIERGGVAAKMLVSHPCLVGLSELGRYPVEWQVLSVTVSHEAIQGLDIMGCRAVSYYFF